MNLNEQLENLSALLEIELRALEELEKTAAGKKHALVKVDVPSVEKWTTLENAAAQNVATASEHRLTAVAKALETMGVPPGLMPLQTIAMRVGEPFRTRLLSQRTSLATAIGKIRRLNQQNQMLGEESLRHVKLFLNAVTGGTEAQPRYTKAGVETRADGAARVNLVDQVA